MTKIMKFAICFIITVSSFILVSNNTNVEASRVKINSTSYNDSASCSKETLELYQDIFLTLLDPIINSSLEKQYNGWVPYDIWDIKVLSAERINPGRTIGFIVKIEVEPYKGAHNPIGIDHLTIKILQGEVPKVVKFQHIKSYD